MRRMWICIQLKQRILFSREGTWSEIGKQITPNVKRFSLNGLLWFCLKRRPTRYDICSRLSCATCLRQVLVAIYSLKQWFGQFTRSNSYRQHVVRDSWELGKFREKSREITIRVKYLFTQLICHRNVILETSLCKTTTFKASYFNRIVCLWNTICKEAPTSVFSSHSQFKSQFSKT